MEVCFETLTLTLNFTAQKAKFSNKDFFSKYDQIGSDIRCISPYSVRMWENTDQKNSKQGHFLRSEKVFEICIKRFKIFVNRAASTPDNGSVAIMAALALHNLLRLKSRDSYTPKGSVDEIQNNGSLLQGEQRKNSRESRYRKMTLIFRKIRISLLKYVNGPGKVPWYLKVVQNYRILEMY